MECGGESAIMAYLWIYSIGKKKPGGYALPGAKPHRKNHKEVITMSKKELVSYLLAQNTALSPAQILLSLTAAVLLALLMYFVYRKTFSGVVYSKNFNSTLVLIAVITTLAMLAIGSNLALSLGMVGSLSIIRFRTAIKEPRTSPFCSGPSASAFAAAPICISLRCWAAQ